MTVLGVTGHQDIPTYARTFVSEGLRREVEAVGTDLIGMTSLAAGADQMFAEAVLTAGGRLHVIVPCEAYEQTFNTVHDRDCYRNLLARAEKMQKLKYREPSEQAFWDAGRQIADSVDVLLAVWDRRKARGLGGTGDIVAYARQQGKPVIILWPPGEQKSEDARATDA